MRIGNVNAGFVELENINDPKMLKQAVSVLDSENRRLIRYTLELKQRVRELEGKEPTQLALEVEELEQKLRVRDRMLFSDKSEKRSGDKRSSSEKESTGHGPREQSQLPQMDKVHALDDADRVCPSCGGELHEWEGQSEDSEEIESIQRCFIRVKHRRLKYRCRCGGCVETAPGPKKLIPGGRYAPSVAMGVAVDKYADHLPLERQARIMTRQGLVMDSQTLWDQLDALARHLEPAYGRLLQYVRSKPVVGGDETTWRLMGQKKSGKGSARWYAWALCAEDAVIYRIDPSRSAEAANKLIGGFQGTIITDGYTAYHALKKQGAPFRLAHCWAHVRRKFIEAEASAPRQAGEILDLIGELYAVEREIATGPPEVRLEARRDKSKPIVARIHRWTLEQTALPRSPIRKAIDYMGSLWPGLQVFLDDPNVRPDNNAVERALRGVVLGRKNHYGSRSQRGTEVAALFYSLLESAKLAGIDPERYLEVATNAALDGALIPLPHELDSGN